MRTRRLVVGLAVAFLGCGDDGDPNRPGPLLAEEVCDLLRADEVAAAVEGPVGAAEVVPGGTPQCSFRYTGASGTTASVVLSVQRTEEDLGGRSGREGFDHALTLSADLSPGGFDPIDGLGDAAAFAAGDVLGLLVVQAGDQVVAVAGEGLERDVAIRIIRPAVERLE
ncbi:hypothetical protein BH24ACT3_BH24ACT3_11900 [soil metagenome]